MRLKQSQCFSSKPQKNQNIVNEFISRKSSKSSLDSRALEFQVVADEIRFLEEILVQEF